jgi:hypothetical protein
MIKSILRIFYDLHSRQNRNDECKSGGPKQGLYSAPKEL